MSEDFSGVLAERVLAFLAGTALKKGRIFSIRSPDARAADELVEKIVRLGNANSTRVRIVGSRRDVHEGDCLALDLPDQVPILIGRVVRDEVDDAAPAYTITAGYATALRNHVAGLNEPHEAMGLLLVTDFDLDTINHASEDLRAPGAPLDLETLLKDATDSDGLESKHARSLMSAIHDMLPPHRISAGDIRVLAKLRSALEHRDYAKVPELIAELPEFLIADNLGASWFEQPGSEAELKRGATTSLKENRRMYNQIAGCFQIGIDPASCLEAKFTETTATQIQRAPDWSMVNFTEVKRGVPQTSSNKFAHFDTSPARNTSGESPGNTSRVKTETRNLRVPLTRREISVKLNFKNDLGDTPFDVRATCNHTETRRGNVLYLTFQPDDHLQAQYALCRVWIGNRTKKSRPRYEFTIALLPDPIYQATADANLGVDFEGTTLVRYGDSPLPVRVDADAPQGKEVQLKHTGQVINATENVTLVPDPGRAQDGTLRCELTEPSGGMIAVTWILDHEIIEKDRVNLPLFLQSITAPEDWAINAPRLPENTRIDLTTGQVSLPTGRTVELPDELTRLIDLEHTMQNRGTLGPFEVAGDGLDLDLRECQTNAGLPPRVVDATDQLLKYFGAQGTTPSTDPWGHATQGAVRKFLEVITSSVPSEHTAGLTDLHDALAFLGSIRSSDKSRVWFSAYHPICLAYTLRLAEWRDTDIEPNGRLSGFRDRRLLDSFSPVGHAPYLQGPDNHLLKGVRVSSTCNWVSYAPQETSLPPTPPFVERVFVDKVEALINSYPVLTDLSSARPIVVNFVNLGSLEPVVDGLFRLFQRRQRAAKAPLVLRLQIMGAPGTGQAIDEFFDPRSESRVRRRLERRDDEVVQSILEHVTFSRSSTDIGKLPEAHLTFIRGFLTESAGEISASAIPSASLRSGLLARESIRPERDTSGISYTVGYGASSGSSLVETIADGYNALFAAQRSGSYDPGRALKKTIRYGDQTALRQIWLSALWVVHIEPNVGLDFYVQSRGESDALLIHYSDQYDPTSSDYDAITSTVHRSHYIESMTRALSEAGLDTLLSADDVLRHLVAADGELALDLQRARGKRLVEYVGLTGALSVAGRLLSEQHPEFTWIPLGLSELVRHTRSRGGSGKGLLQYTKPGAACDDLCFVGLPKTGPLRLPLWVVEAKGGRSSTMKGAEQVIGARHQLRDLLTSEGGWSDHDLVKGTFGRVVADVAARLHHYDLLGEPLSSKIKSALLSGDFEVWFPRDVDGHDGLVVQVRPDVAVASTHSVEEIRVLECTPNCLRVIGGEPLEHAIEGVDPARLALDLTRPPSVRAPTSHSNREAMPISEEATALDDGPSEDDAETPPTASQAHLEKPSRTDLPAGAAIRPEDLLEQASKPSLDVDVAQIIRSIERSCKNHGIQIRPPTLSNSHVGPRHVSIPLVLKEGQKTSRLMGALDDISREARSAGRITAQLSPSEGAIRLLIPHDAEVPIRLVQFFEIHDPAQWPSLRVPLGADAEMIHHSMDLLNERHALIAGATGSGKSVFLKSALTSLCLQYGPEQLDITILDPKGLDFQQYAKLPHVGTDGYIDDPAQCVNYVLRVLEEEFAARRAFLRDAGHPSLSDFYEGSDSNEDPTLPFRVIVIDEYADLVMGLGNQRDTFEEAICRIAQMGRALGYVILLSTQRPTADIVSGRIKANFPCRISFKLPTSTDSQVVLDEPGAQHLLGAGDMLVKSQDLGEKRLQGYFVPPSEVSRVLDAILADVLSPESQ